MDIVMGIAGAVAGGSIPRFSSFPGHGEMIYLILVAILGAVILTGRAGYASGRKRVA